MVDLRLLESFSLTRAINSSTRAGKERLRGRVYPRTSAGGCRSSPCEKGLMPQIAIPLRDAAAVLRGADHGE